MKGFFCDYAIHALAGKAGSFHHDPKRFIGKEFVDALAPVFDLLLNEDTLRQLNHGFSTSLNESVNYMYWKFSSKVNFSMGSKTKI